MSPKLSENPTWIEVLDAKAHLVHQQIAALQRWNEDAGGDDAVLEQLCEPYYEILRSIYEEDYPLAHAIQSSDLLIHLKGSAVDHPNPRLSLIASIFSSVRKQVGSVAFAISGVANRVTLPKDLDLGLSGFAPGSLYLGFAVPPPDAENERGERRLLGEEDPLYKATKEAIKTIGLVTRSLDTEHPEEELARLIPDPKVRDTAISAIHKIAPSGRMGIDSVAIGGRGTGVTDTTVLTPAIRQRISDMIEHPVRSEDIATFTGVVREIDLDIRRFELRRITGASIEDVRCIYGEEYDNIAETLLNKTLTVAGKVDRSNEGNPRLVEIGTMEIVIQNV